MKELEAFTLNLNITDLFNVVRQGFGLGIGATYSKTFNTSSSNAISEHFMQAKNNIDLCSHIITD